MFRPDPKDLAVDLAAWSVRHSSGAVIKFRSYECEADWLRSDVGTIERGDLFRGPQDELIRGAKQAAIAAGMRYC